MAIQAVKKILLVDDDVDLAETLFELLSSLGYEVVWCGDGQKALEAIGRGSPDLLLVDGTMPVRDGFSVLRELKEQSPSFPIVLMSAESPQATQEELGWTAFLKKPVKFEELADLIAASLAQQSSRQRA